MPPKKIARRHSLHEPAKHAKPAKLSMPKGVASDLNEHGEVIFKPKKLKPDKHAGGKPQAKAEKRAKDSLGIPELDRLAQEVMRSPRPKIDRLKTGIPGLDELITGGIPRESVVLVTGSAGSGKSIFGLQFLVNGAAMFGEPGVFVSFEEEPESIRQAGELFEWDMEKLEKQNLVRTIFQDPYEIKSFSSTFSGPLYNTLREMKAKRIVFDSLNYLSMLQENPLKLRKNLAELSKRLKKLGITTIFLSEASEETHTPSVLKYDEFASDGVIRLYNLLMKGTRNRAIEVMKLRKTNHDMLLHPFSVTDRGIVVYPKEIVSVD